MSDSPELEVRCSCGYVKSSSTSDVEESFGQHVASEHAREVVHFSMHRVVVVEWSPPEAFHSYTPDDRTPPLEGEGATVLR